MQEQRQITAAVIALAGRRIDAADAAMPRFPLENIPLVRKRLADLLVQERAVALVCSAACGADLIALEEALVAFVRNVPRRPTPTDPML